MKTSTGITLVESNVQFEEKLLEDFVNSSYVYKPVRERKSSEQTIFSETYSSVNCCFAQLPGCGTVDIVATTPDPGMLQHICIPSISMFLVICTRNEVGNYKVTWSCSMS